MKLKPVSKPIKASRITLKGVPEGTIYHYTTSLAFQKIIQSGAFHLSYYRDLKDNDELTWAVDHYKKTVEHLFPVEMNFDALLPTNYFIFCTCLRSNNKYLWEHYASSTGGDYSGIVLALHAEAFYEYYSIHLKKIHMSSMDYDSEAFIKLCQDSVEGLPPIAFVPVAVHGNPHAYSEQEREELLNRIPGYKEYRAKRQPVFEALTLQKREHFSKEEEMRIIHWGEVNSPLEKVVVDNKTKVILPWKGRKQHFIKEIIRLPECSLSESAINSLLRKSELEIPIRNLKSEDIS